ncbi:PqqD family protein [Bacillus sp. SD088]|uniref:PqqD family protein n=1 Tax=Bacillus sp. SD088 TaxID=2782012 RepID=UPI001A9662B3|nr:PqqD family protein [Bacillus sp. SD088]MBO0995914.1 PqqD family protein [Bacillus sp. SD088]
MESYKISESVLSVEAESQTVLLETNSGQYYALDSIGGEIWEGIKEGKGVEEIASEISREYDFPITEVTKDVKALISDLVKSHLVVN